MLPLRVPRIPCAVVFLLCASCGGSQGDGSPKDAPLAGLVDPFIGTLNDGQTFPGAVVPWGMASASPHNARRSLVDSLSGNGANAGYLFGESELFGFGVAHLSGVGCPALGAPVLVPVLGEPPTSRDEYGSAYDNEQAHAGYYEVELTPSRIRAELTATPRAAALRFSFPKGQARSLLVDTGRGLSVVQDAGDVRVVGPDLIEGSVGWGLFCVTTGGGRLYFSLKVDAPATERGVIQDGVLTSAQEGEGDAVAFLRYADDAPQTVTAWVGLSWVSVDNARDNREAEAQAFDEARDAAARAWQAVLGRIEVTGGSASDRTRFYTALYHALIHPSVVNDVNGDYPRFERDEVGNVSGENRYTVFSLWDTYRTVHPLLTLVYPEVQLQMLRTMADMTLSAAAPPKWELGANEVQMMVGDSAAIVFADSYQKGLTDFDAETTYDVLRTAATDPGHRPAVDDYLALGYVPMERTEAWGPVSTTLEYALADWSLAQLAESLGREEDVPALLTRATSYRTLFDGETLTLRPKNMNGSFLSPFNPDAEQTPGDLRLGGPGYVEGTAWNYAFFAPHDVDGLVALFGEAAFVERLQWVFDTDRFAMWNEPDIHYPYLFTYVGEAARTQRAVRETMARYFTTEPGGIPGNDDTGTLSAWFVFSAMGFYPALPGAPEYRLGSPLFDRVTIHLSPSHHTGETFILEATGNGAEVFYVTEAELNGSPIAESVLQHRDITEGGTLRLQMSTSPE